MRRLIDRIARAWATDFRVRKRMRIDWDIWNNTGMRIPPEPMPCYVLQYRLLPFVWIDIRTFAEGNPKDAQFRALAALHYLTYD